VAWVLVEEVTALCVSRAIMAGLGMVLKTWHCQQQLEKAKEGGGEGERESCETDDHIQKRSRLKRPPLPICVEISRGLLRRSQSVEAVSAPPGNRQPIPMMAIGSLRYCEEGIMPR
jgi:hypothetical protein